MKEANTAGNTDSAAVTSTLQEALVLVRGMTSAAERDKVLGDIAKSQILVGDVAGALASAGSVTDLKLRMLAMSRVREAQVQTDDLVGALATLQEALASLSSGDNEGALGELKESLAVDLAETQAKGGDFLRALSTARAITDKLMGAVALAKVAKALVQCDGVHCSPLR